MHYAMFSGDSTINSMDFGNVLFKDFTSSSKDDSGGTGTKKGNSEDAPKANPAARSK